MRRSGLLLVVLTLAGCSALRDAFSAHPEVAGSVAGEALSVERLADLAGHTKRIPLRVDVLTTIAGVYLDYVVFATELARGRNLDDSALVLAAEWPAVSQTRWDRFHDRLVAARTNLTGPETDSVYHAGTLRLFQHILIRVPPNASPPVELAKKRQAESVLRQATAAHGATFAALAKRYSEDPGSNARGGYLPAATRGQFVPAFDTVAWRLEPGALSPIVRSPFGFHIIRRPPLSEVRDTFRTEVETGRTMRFDSLYLDSLAILRHVKVESSAPALVRQAVPEILAAQQDARTVATYRGGVLRVKDVARWLLALNPNDVRGITTASDDQLVQFVRVLAQREILLQQVDSAGVALTPDDWKQIHAQYDSVVGTLEHLMELSPELLKDSAATPAARRALAVAHVNAYLDRALKEGSVQFFPVPPFLAAALRGSEPRSLNEAGIARALERAQALRTAADSLGRGTPPAGLKPAPGPAPVPPTGPAAPGRPAPTGPGRRPPR